MADKRVIEQTASTELFDDDWFLKDSVLEGTTKISASVLAELFAGDVNDRVDKLLRNIIGPTYEWSASKTYKAGAIVYYEDSLYFCIVDTATVGTFVPSEWRYTDLYENLTGKINSVIKMLAPYMQFSDISSIMPYSKGDIVRYQPTGTYKEKFYVAKEDLPEGIESYDPNDWDEYDTIGELIAGIMAEAGKVDDVKVDGTSVVTNKVAEIEIPVKDVQVKTDSTYDSVVDASGNAKIDLSSMTAYGEVPNLPQAIASFKDGADAPMKSLKVAIEPQQDLHGYDSPWVGGAGKNKLQNTTNTQTINGVTFTVNEDGTVKANGTATDAIMLVLNTTGFTLPSGNYKISAGVEGTSGTSYFVCSNYASGQRDYTNDGAFTSDGSITYRPSIYIVSGVTLSNVVFKPMIRLASIQDDSFEPYSNISPITGYTEANVTRCGKNLFDESILLECSGWTVSDGVYSGDSVNINAKYGNGVPNLAFKPNTQYTFSFTYGQDGSAGIGLAVVIRYADDTATPKYCNLDSIGFVSVTSTAGKSIKRLELSYGANRTIHLSNMQLEEGTTATTYEPYAGTTYTIDLDGTRYGGELDVTSGVLTVDMKTVDLSTLSWSTTSLDRQIALLPDAKPAPDNNTKAKIFCDRYPTDTANALISKPTEFLIAINDNKGVMCRTSDGNTPQGQLVYELATPQTIQLTPTQVNSLLGSNNVWDDTGDVNECVYRRDMSSTIDDIIARLEALEG